MTRFAWLQARTATVAATAALVLLAILAAITGVHLSHLYSSNVAHCDTGCDLAIQQFLSHDSWLQHALDLVARMVPALLGVFWGAPLLSRELDSGTYRLAWTQSVSRSRWVATKLGVGAVSTVAVAGFLTLIITWWYRALDTTQENAFGLFDRRDVTPIAYALFAFATGALLGAIIRRTVPAMAATLAVYIFTLVAATSWIRPHLLTAKHLTTATGDEPLGLTRSNGGAFSLIGKASGPPGSWTLSNQVVDGTGRPPSSAQLAAWLHANCPSVALPPPVIGNKHVARVIGPDGPDACLTKASNTFHVAVSYIPADRYWTLQWLEAGIFTALAVAAAAACYWWVTRRAR